MALSAEMRETVRDWMEIPSPEVLFNAIDLWLTQHDREVSEAAWARGRTDSTDLVLDGAGFRVVAVNADNPYSITQVVPPVDGEL